MGHQAPCPMDREITLGPLLGTQSPTPVTQGTDWLQVVQRELVSQVACGQGVLLHAQVSLITIV